MGIVISYCIGTLCIIFPKVCAKVIAEIFDQMTKYKYGAAPEEQKQVRSIFSILVGIVILGLTYVVQVKGSG